MKLTKIQRRDHAEAMEILQQDTLESHERDIVLEQYHPGATRDHGKQAAFFTPLGLARDARIEVSGNRIVDLGAGIGRLSRALLDQHGGPTDVVCIERDQDFVAIGRKVVPEATWICADAFKAETWNDLGQFDCMVSNPPYGLTVREPWVASTKSEYVAAEICSRVASYGVFILPQGGLPWQFSGRQGFERVDPGGPYEKFSKATGWEVAPNCGIDTAAHPFDDVSIAVEVGIVQEREDQRT